MRFNTEDSLLNLYFKWLQSEDFLTFLRLNISERSPENILYTSQQEGYHVSCELLQAQGMTGVAPLDLKQPDVILLLVFDPVLITELNAASKRVTGKEKYPVLRLSDRDTGERFGLEYIESGCRPVPLDQNKH